MDYSLKTLNKHQQNVFTSSTTMAGNSWTNLINNELEKMTDTTKEKEYWQKRSIYRVPACVTDLNKRAYVPQAVSFGPYHHSKPHLTLMEEHKQRALLHFLKRCKKPLKLFIDSVAEVVQDLKDSYHSLDSKWQDDNLFLQLMILDGCFMLEILRSADQIPGDYADNDPIFSEHGKMYIIPYIKRDMLMLENQLPLIVLEKLLACDDTRPKDDEYLNKLVLMFCSPRTPVPVLGECLHALDIYRKSLLQKEPKGKKPRHRYNGMDDMGGDDIIRSATELNEAGIQFNKSRTTSLKDISFHKGVLTLPPIVVDDATESLFLNLIAFERFHVGAGNEVTSYIFFMDNIIDNAKDVVLLHSRGIVLNALGSDKDVAKLFNSLSRDITLDPYSRLNEVRIRVQHYYKKPWNEWKANLIHTYFRNPWAILSLVAAALLFALTIVQTVYSILPFYENSTPPPPPSSHPLVSRPPPHIGSRRSGTIYHAAVPFPPPSHL